MTVNVSNSPLFKEILGFEFLNKFLTLTFDYYSGVSDPVQHFSYLRDKMYLLPQ